MPSSIAVFWKIFKGDQAFDANPRFSQDFHMVIKSVYGWGWQPWPSDFHVFLYTGIVWRAFARHAPPPFTMNGAVPHRCDL